MVVVRHGRTAGSGSHTAAWLLAGLILSGAACAAPKPRSKPADRTPSSRTSRTTSGGNAKQPAETYVSTESMPGRIHVVQRGDTLWSLAEHYYGSGKHLHRIRLANRNRLTDPEDLPVNMKLIIP